MHSTAEALCAACHRSHPRDKATPLGEQREQPARALARMCQPNQSWMPWVVVWIFTPSNHWPLLQRRLLGRTIPRSLQYVHVYQHCSMFHQGMTADKWYSWRAEVSEGTAETYTRKGTKGASHLHYSDCFARYIPKSRARGHEVSVNNTPRSYM